MANLTQGTASEVIVGPARLLIAPIGSTIPTLTSATVVWDAAWKECGYTDAGTDFSYAPSVKDIDVDEEASPVKKLLDKEKANITAKLAQATLDNLHAAISASKLSTAAAAGGGFVGTKTVKVGTGLLTETMVGLEGLSPEGFWRVIIGYRAIAQANVQLAFKRTDKTVIPVDFGLLADSTKPAGERLFLMVDMIAAATS